MGKNDAVRLDETRMFALARMMENKICTLQSDADKPTRVKKRHS